ncbi:hypothetical protein Nepgr_018658 [Nepenthes gracilis]|uniref:Uncharacterized protein n=1 Tax=Nepenthes gracilis TaxID=150966 RepID=A0AAD3SUJ8_NEPGR|nr:hypothetical protein Nepgr_018658 [Nepenthes gracilis]
MHGEPWQFHPSLMFFLSSLSDVGLYSSSHKAPLTIRGLALTINGIAVLVRLFLEKANKIETVRLGIIPQLIGVFLCEFWELQEHMIGVIFCLSLEDDNNTTLPPLLHALILENGKHENFKMA